MLTIKNVTKSYGRGVPAVSNVSITVAPGVWGLLGPNGAGKSTLMKIVATLLTADRGEVRFDGIDVVREPYRVRERLGYLPQDYGFYPSFTVTRMLDYLASLKGLGPARRRRRHVQALLERVNLASAARARVGELSHGMRQRLGVAQALLGSPALLVVDEPTAGLDPEERRRLHRLLAGIADDVVVVLSTHIVSDVAAVCHRFALLQQGRLVLDTTPGEAVGSLQGAIFEGEVDAECAERLGLDYPIVSRMASADGHMRVKLQSTTGPPTDAFTAATPTLEDVYVCATGTAEGRV